MIMFSLLFFFVLFLSASPCQSTFAQAPITQTIHTESTTTVAELFSSSSQDGTTLHFPDCAHFRYSYNQKNLKTERLFYATSTCRIPMQSFVQFMKKGHTLFHDTAMRRTYRTAVIKAVRAQRQINFKPTARAHCRLETAKKQMFDLLQTLPLSDSRIRTSLEKILSIKPSSLLKEINFPLKALLKSFGTFCAVILWSPFCCFIGAHLAGNNHPNGFAGVLLGLEVGICSLLGFGIYSLYRAFKNKKLSESQDFFNHDEIMPVTIRIELTPVVNVEFKQEDTLDLTTTHTQC